MNRVRRDNNIPYLVSGIVLIKFFTPQVNLNYLRATLIWKLDVTKNNLCNNYVYGIVIFHIKLPELKSSDFDYISGPQHSFVGGAY